MKVIAASALPSPAVKFSPVVPASVSVPWPTDSVTFTVAGPPPSGSTSVIPVRLTLPPSFNEKDADEDCGWGIWSVIGFQFLETAQSKVEFRLGGDTEVTWPYTTLYNSVQVVRKVFKLPLTQEKC